MAPPFRATHIGSLIRPQELIDARQAAKTDLYSQKSDGLESITNKCIGEVVQQQSERHVRPITSGEYEREIFSGGFYENIQGVKTEEASTSTAWRTNFGPIKYEREALGRKSRPRLFVTEKIRFEKSVFLDDFNYLKSVLPESLWGECKITMPPVTGLYSRFMPGTTCTKGSGYTDDKEHLSDLAAFYRQEFRALYDAGLRHIQIDDPYMTFFIAEDYREGTRIDGEDPDELLDLSIWAHNETLKELADMPGLHVGVHLCRGNFGKQHFVSGGYDRIAKKLFNELNFDTFLLEYDTERAGDFEPLRHLPVGKTVVLGVVSTKEPELEDVNQLSERVYQAADVIAEGQGRSREEVLRDSIAISPQCGFASVAYAKQMAIDRMWEKLELLQKVVKIVWGD